MESDIEKSLSSKWDGVKICLNYLIRQTVCVCLFSCSWNVWQEKACISHSQNLFCLLLYPALLRLWMINILRLTLLSAPLHWSLPIMLFCTFFSLLLHLFNYPCHLNRELELDDANWLFEQHNHVLQTKLPPTFSLSTSSKITWHGSRLARFLLSQDVTENVR